MDGTKERLVSREKELTLSLRRTLAHLFLQLSFLTMFWWHTRFSAVTFCFFTFVTWICVEEALPKIVYFVGFCIVVILAYYVGLPASGHSNLDFPALVLHALAYTTFWLATISIDEIRGHLHLRSQKRRKLSQIVTRRDRRERERTGNKMLGQMYVLGGSDRLVH